MTHSLEVLAQLDHSKEFARLQQKFSQFNPLKVLRVDQFEIRHSNVLAWLLDPHENHQLGSFFLKKLLSRLVTRVENEEKVDNVDFLPFFYASFSDAEVYREVKTQTQRYIDLLVVVPSQRLVLVIENKFHAGESEGQLQDYLTYARDKFGGVDYTILPVFLTLASAPPSHPAYWILDYNDVLDILSTHLELEREAIADSVYEFLHFYTSILKEELVPDDEAMQLAQEVYQVHKSAIDFLFLSQHVEFNNQPRYREVFQLMDALTDRHKEAMKRIYEKRKQTVDYIFKMGSNMLREAFLRFVQVEDIPEENYKAHVQVPHFILPDWGDFQETIGKPEQGYWLGQGLILWFERTWDERLKITMEVGPIPFEKRIQFLTALESHGIAIRATAKVEGRKYTKIYTQTTEISDWTNKNVIVEGMEGLYHDANLESTFKEIALAVESMKDEMEEEQVQMEHEVHYSVSKKKIPEGAFSKFVEAQGIPTEDYRIRGRLASFLMPSFRKLEKNYGTTTVNWWGYNSTFVYWFERLKDDRLKLTLEVGPLQPEQRLSLIEKLEELGLSFSSQAKLLTAKYSRLFSKGKVINDWEDEAEVFEGMEELFGDERNQEVLGMIEQVLICS